MAEQIDVTIGQRLKHLRELTGLSQEKTARLFGGQQASLHRYETGETVVPHRVLLWYADYFNISLDYLYGRCDEPKGMLLSGERFARFENEQQMKEFIEMCFDPQSKYNEKLKSAIFDMMKEGVN